MRIRHGRYGHGWPSKFQCTATGSPNSGLTDVSWATDMINLGTWQTASSIIAVGLTWRDSLPIMAVGTLCVAIPMVLNGAIGAHLHIPFSIVVRSGFGYNFAYFCIVSRCILAMFWLGIQSANGAQAMTVMLASIWPSYWNYDYDGSRNSLPRSAGLSTQGMISYFLFWIIQLPLLMIPPTRLRWLFIIKLIFAPIAAIAMMAWSVHRAGGSGELFNLPPSVSGEERAWLWLSCMTAVTGVWSTLACNIMGPSPLVPIQHYQLIAPQTSPATPALPRPTRAALQHNTSNSPSSPSSSPSAAPSASSPPPPPTSSTAPTTGIPSTSSRSGPAPAPPAGGQRPFSPLWRGTWRRSVRTSRPTASPPRTT